LAVDDDNVTVDGNNPMAGKILNFDIELVEIID
jgi:FKBP-type peptidyl-prolyl cis-trans isomerase 2